MNKLWSVLLAVSMVLGSSEAWAKRLGGGSSIGKQSSNVTQRSTAPSQPAPTQGTQAAPAQAPATAANRPATTAPAQAPKRPWGAMLGGLAAGLGLAWLAHSLGLGEAFGQVLLFGLLALVIMVVIGMVMRARNRGQGGAGTLAYAGAGASPAAARSYSPDKVGNDASARPWEQEATLRQASTAPAGGSMIGSALGAGVLSGSQGWGIPADFDTAGFLAAAKRNFVTLQAAWDRADIPTLRSMMTDAMLAEIQAQLAERERLGGSQPNQTDVVMLDAQLLGIEDLGDAYLASVEFNGMIREEPSAGPSPFREVWNMSKAKDGRTGWLVAGVQALQ